MLREDEVRQAGDALEVAEVADERSFEALEPEWNALVERANDQLFYRHEFLRLWLQHFAPPGSLRVLIARDGTGRLKAALPLFDERTFTLGVPLRQRSAAANAHSCRWDLVADDPLAAARAFFDHLQANRTWRAMRFQETPADGQAMALFELARSRGLPTAQIPSIESPYIPLTSDFETYLGTLDGKFRANLRRRRKRLAEKGRVELEFFTGGPELLQRLDEGFELERRGWKGQGGTAIAQSPETRAFYLSLARWAETKGALALVFLRLDGRAVAFHYALTHQRKYLLLKPAYDETLRECSPGQLLLEDALRECFARGFTELDFLGPEMPWKREWTKLVRPHLRLHVFRDTRLGKALCGARYVIAPKAKRWGLRQRDRLKDALTLALSRRERELTGGAE